MEVIIPFLVLKFQWSISRNGKGCRLHKWVWRFWKLVVRDQPRVENCHKDLYHMRGGVGDQLGTRKVTTRTFIISSSKIDKWQSRVCAAAHQWGGAELEGSRVSHPLLLLSKQSFKNLLIFSFMTPLQALCTLFRIYKTAMITAWVSQHHNAEGVWSQQQAVTSHCCTLYMLIHSRLKGIFQCGWNLIILKFPFGMWFLNYHIGCMEVEEMS